MGGFTSENAMSAFGKELVTKTMTFSNTTGAQTLFTVTGHVIVRVVSVCTTACASAGACNVEIGTAASTAAITAQTDVTLLAAEEIWHDATPDAEIEAMSVLSDHIITDGNDIILTLSAQVDSGVVAFYCIWTPLSSDANVVAA